MNKDLGFIFGCRLEDLFGIPTCMAKNVWGFGAFGAGFGILIWLVVWGLISGSHPSVGYLRIFIQIGFILGFSEALRGFIWSFHLEVGLICNHLLHTHHTHTDPSSSPRECTFSRDFFGKDLHLFETVSKEAMPAEHKGQNYDQILALLRH